MSGREWKSGDRVRVYASPGPVGTPPAQGARGVVESQREDGTVFVNMADGRRILVASWELKSDE